MHSPRRSALSDGRNSEQMHSGQTLWNRIQCGQMALLPNGKAGRAGIISQLQCRYAKIQPSADWIITTRLVHCIVTVGAIHFQLFAIYGVAQSVPNGGAYTEAILAEAIRRSKFLSLPSIFAGDFNLKIEDSLGYKSLQEEGYQHLGEMHRRIMGSDMPYTCKAATNPDDAIIHPQLAQFVKKIVVDKKKAFDAHDPIYVTFALPDKPLDQLRFYRPVSWTEIPIIKDMLDYVAHFGVARKLS